VNDDYDCDWFVCEGEVYYIVWEIKEKQEGERENATETRLKLRLWRDSLYCFFDICFERKLLKCPCLFDNMFMLCWT
jgi:hypothetical protein